MFRAVPCSSSGGKIILSQPLVLSLSVNGRTVRRLRADCSHAGRDKLQSLGDDQELWTDWLALNVQVLLPK